MEQYIFTLYVAGSGELTARAQANFDRVIGARLRGRCTLTTVDVLREPGLARQHRVVATPLLVRERPPPLVKILGDLSQEARILTQLGLAAHGAEPDGPAGRPEGNDS